jgi:hypothetical protein
MYSLPFQCPKIPFSCDQSSAEQGAQYEPGTPPHKQLSVLASFLRRERTDS